MSHLPHEVLAAEPQRGRQSPDVWPGPERRPVESETSGITAGDPLTGRMGTSALGRNGRRTVLPCASAQAGPWDGARRGRAGGQRLSLALPAPAGAVSAERGAAAWQEHTALSPSASHTALRPVSGETGAHLLLMV